MLHNGKRIMIVESDTDVLSIIYLALLHQDYVLEATADACEVKPRMERFKPDLVLISHNMPGADVNSLCAIIKNTLQIPVILLSNPYPALYVNHLKTDDVLEKPVNTDLMLSKISSLLLA